MKLAKELAKQAEKFNICNEWDDRLKTLEDKREMAEMYIKGIDFCLSNDFPSNEFIKENFGEVIEEYGIYIDKTINLTNPRRCVALGSTTGGIEINSYRVCEVFAKHDSKLSIMAKDNAFVEIDAFDNSVLKIVAEGKAKIHINKYEGSTISFDKNDESMIKIVDKHRKTY